MRRLVALLLCACGAASTPSAAPARPAPSVVTRPNAPEVPVVSVQSSWDDDFPKAWTDPRVVAKLAADCDFEMPPRPAQDDASPDFEPNDIFHCTMPFAQSCAMDPCEGVFNDCRERCGKTCGTCGRGCANVCKTCKASCADDKCRAACATECATCKQSCGRQMDRCSSGACARESETCWTDFKKQFVKSGCKAKCDGYVRCTKRCKDDDYACVGACHEKMDARYEACLKKCRDGDDACPGKCSNETCPLYWCQMGLE